MRRAGLFTLLLLKALTSLAAPPQRPEIALGSPSRDAVGSKDISAASSGIDAFAVWNDSRRGVAFGTPIDGNGQISTPWGAQLANANVPTKNAVVWTGDSYLVVLIGYVPSGASYGASSMLLGRDGTIQRTMVRFGSAGYEPGVWANGKRVLLIQGLTISFLDPLTGTALEIGRLPAGGLQPVAVGRDDGFNVFVLDNSKFDRGSLHRIHVDNSGTVTDRVLSGDLPLTTHLAVATDGRSDLLVWDQISIGPRFTISGLLLGPDGIADAPGAVLLEHVSQGGAEDSQYWAAVTTAAWDGRQFAVGYIESYDGVTASFGVKKVTADGKAAPAVETIIDRSESAAKNGSLTSTLALCGQRRLLFWCSSRTSVSGYSHGDAYVTLFRAFDSFESIDTAPTQTLARAPMRQGEPALSTDGSVIAAAWRESDFSPAIVAQIVDPRGRTSAPAILSTTTSIVSPPAIASGGNAHLVVWREYNKDTNGFPVTYRILARLLRNDGTAAAPLILEAGTYPSLPYLRTSQYSVSVVWDGTSFVVAWTAAGGQLYMSRISGQGDRLETRPLLGDGAPAEAFSIQLVNLGADAFAVYFARDSKVIGTEITIEGTRISRSGSVGEQVTFVGAFDNVQSDCPFTLASDGSNVLIAWQERAFGLPPRDLARIFYPDGRPQSAAVRIGDGLSYWQQSIGRFIYDSGGWWLLTRLGHVAPVAQKLGPNLEPNGAPLEIAAIESSPLDSVGVLQNHRLVTICPRMAEFAPGVMSQRLFLQWIVLGSKERAVRR